MVDISTIHMQTSLDISTKNRNNFGRTRQVLGSPWKNKDRSFPQRGSAEAECLSVKKTKRRCAKGGEKPMESADLLPISGHEPLPLSILQLRSNDAHQKEMMKLMEFGGSMFAILCSFSGRV